MAKKKSMLFRKFCASSPVIHELLYIFCLVFDTHSTITYNYFHIYHDIYKKKKILKLFKIY